MVYIINEHFPKKGSQSGCFVSTLANRKQRQRFDRKMEGSKGSRDMGLGEEFQYLPIIKLNVEMFSRKQLGPRKVQGSDVSGAFQPRTPS